MPNQPPYSFLHNILRSRDMFFFTEGMKEGCLWECTLDSWQLLAVHAPSSPGCFGCLHRWDLGKCANINHFLFHCSFLTARWPGLADTNIFTGPSFISSGLSLPWSFRARPRSHHRGTSQDALTTICSCFLWLVSVAGLCGLMQSSRGSVCFLLQRGTGRNWSYHAPAYSPCLQGGASHRHVLFFSILQSLLSYHFQPTSPVCNWILIQDQASAGNIWASSLLLSLFYRHKIHVLYCCFPFPLSKLTFSPYTSDHRVLKCWNETWSSCLFPSTFSQASRQSCCCFAPFVPLYHTYQLLVQSLVPGLSALTSKAHKSQELSSKLHYHTKYIKNRMQTCKWFLDFCLF